MPLPPINNWDQASVLHGRIASGQVNADMNDLLIVWAQSLDCWKQDMNLLVKQSMIARAERMFKGYGYSESTVNELLNYVESLCKSNFTPNDAFSFVDRILCLKIEAENR